MVRGPEPRSVNEPAPAREGSTGARTALAAGALDIFATELVRQLGSGLEAYFHEALEAVLLQQRAPALLDRQNLAYELRCGVDTIDKLRREGMPELRVGDAPRFELARVLDWLRGRV